MGSSTLAHAESKADRRNEGEPREPATEPAVEPPRRLRDIDQRGARRLYDCPNCKHEIEKPRSPNAGFAAYSMFKPSNHDSNRHRYRENRARSVERPRHRPEPRRSRTRSGRASMLVYDVVLLLAREAGDPYPSRSSCTPVYWPRAYSEGSRSNRSSYSAARHTNVKPSVSACGVEHRDAVVRTVGWCWPGGLTFCRSLRQLAEAVSHVEGF